MSMLVSILIAIDITGSRSGRIDRLPRTTEKGGVDLATSKAVMDPLSRMLGAILPTSTSVVPNAVAVVFVPKVRRYSYLSLAVVVYLDGS
ncbi:MAG: hypothetical protein ABJ059_16655 [Hyphomicrobiales bacterium]